MGSEMCIRDSSLSLFFILAGFTVMIGLSLKKVGRVPLSVGDLQLTGAGVFALVVLKIAFQRADHLHLIIPFIPLIVILLINQSRSGLTSSSLLRRCMLSAIVVVSLAHAVGQLPTGRWVLFGTVRGWLHEVSNRPVVGDVDSRLVGTVSERSEANANTLQLAARLNAADLRDKPVLFYGSIWDESFKGGVCPVGYSFYDILYSDDRKPLLDTIRSTPDLIVVMKGSDYDRLFLSADPVSNPRQAGMLKTIGRIVSSVHFTETLLENEIEYNLWKESLGDHLFSTYKLKERLNGTVLLERVI